MPRFAIYYVPQAEDEFYRLGTSIVGYDFEPYVQFTIRSVCLLVQMDNETNWHIYREFVRPTDQSRTE